MRNHVEDVTRTAPPSANILAQQRYGRKHDQLTKSDVVTLGRQNGKCIQLILSPKIAFKLKKQNIRIVDIFFIFVVPEVAIYNNILYSWAAKWEKKNKTVINTNSITHNTSTQ